MAEVTLVSAYHNYLVDGRLRRDLMVGDPQETSGFFLVAHPVSHGEPMPLLSGRFFGPDGRFLLRLEKNVLVENPNGFSLLETQKGWALMDTALTSLLSVEVRSFENAHLTIVRGKMHDPQGKLMVHGDNKGLHVLASRQ